MTGMGVWEASKVMMFYFLTWMVLFYNNLLKCTFTFYVVICVVAVFHDKSSHPPKIIQVHPQNSTNTQLK